LDESLTRVREFAAGHGRSESAVRGAVYCWSAVDPDATWARRTAIETVSRIYRQDFTQFVDSYLLAGGPQQVVDRLGEFAAAGATSVVFAPACPDSELARVINTFVADVLPAFRTAAEGAGHG
jgi:alkanesulfonate monooxygenase SsuD/methylene tetrahydromethanopterin reductase-like flavin-dependent oxidoreductase (luciferase family)